MFHQVVTTSFIPLILNKFLNYEFGTNVQFLYQDKNIRLYNNILLKYLKLLYFSLSTKNFIFDVNGKITLKLIHGKLTPQFKSLVVTLTMEEFLVSMNLYF